jgi:hypothetical protein
MVTSVTSSHSPLPVRCMVFTMCAGPALRRWSLRPMGSLIEDPTHDMRHETMMSIPVVRIGGE